MHSLRRAIGIALTLFAASVIGMALQWVVPGQVLTEAKGTVGAMVGLVTLLLALVLGLLVFTAFSVFTTQRDEAQSLGPIIIELDLALGQYGPEAAQGRLGLRAALERSRARFFGDADHGPRPYTAEEMGATLSGLANYFDSLQPSTDTQRRCLDSARDLAKKFADTQMLMARQLANPFPPYVLIVVVCWASALFLGNGLVAAPNVGHRCRASRRRDRHRQRNLPHAGAEPALHRRSPALIRRPRQTHPAAWGGGRQAGLMGYSCEASWPGACTCRDEPTLFQRREGCWGQESRCGWLRRWGPSPLALVPGLVPGGVVQERSPLRLAVRQ